MLLGEPWRVLSGSQSGQPLLCADVEIIEGVNLVQEETKQKRGGEKSGAHVKTHCQ